MLEIVLKTSDIFESSKNFVEAFGKFLKGLQLNLETFKMSKRLVEASDNFQKIFNSNWLFLKWF